jgi:HEAT repeat protein
LSDSDVTRAGTGDTLPEAYSRNAVLFIVNAHAATVNMRLYPPTSSMVTETFDKAREALDVVFEDSDIISIATVENSLMVNDVRLSDMEQAKAPIRSFVAWMNDNGLSIIEFRKGLKGEELQAFFSTLNEMADAQDRVKLAEDLKEQGVEHIGVNQRVYVAVTTSDTGEIIGGVQGTTAPLEALKDELLMRYLMGKVDLGTVEDRELVDVLSDAGKVGGLLSRFLGEEGNEGGVYMKSQKAEEALNSLADMVAEIDDETLRESMSGQITQVIAEMSPREMTSVLSGHAPENLNIRHVRENVITMLSDNQLLDIIDSLIDEYTEMKGESGELDTEWTKQRLRDLNDLLSDVRGERSEAISEAIDKKLDEAGIAEERDPHTGTRVMSAYQMLGGPLEEEDLDLGEGVDQTVPRQIRQLYAMEESDLAAGLLLKIIDNLRQDAPAVRRFAVRLINETIEGLDAEHALQAIDVIRPRMVEDVEREDDYETFKIELDMVANIAELFMKAGRAEDSSVMIELLMAEGSDDSGKGEELVRVAREAMNRLMGPEGMIDAEALLLEDDENKRFKTVKALAALGPTALAPLVDMVKDRGQVELRDRALEAIQAAGPTGIQALLGELEKENPWYIYRNILNVVADLKLTEGLPQVTAMVSNPDERIRREAVRSLARIGSRDSISAVMTAAGDQSIAVRKTAVRVLGMFGDASVAAFLTDTINGQGLRGKEEDQGVVESAVLALGDLRDPSLIPQLMELLAKGGLFKKSRPDEVRAAACLALGNIGDMSALPILEKTAKDPSVMVRSSADKAIKRLKGGVVAPEPLAPEEADAVLGGAEESFEPMPARAPEEAPPTDVAAWRPPEAEEPQPVEQVPEPVTADPEQQPTPESQPEPEPVILRSEPEPAPVHLTPEPPPEPMVTELLPPPVQLEEQAEPTPAELAETEPPTEIESLLGVSQTDPSEEPVQTSPAQPADPTPEPSSLEYLISEQNKEGAAPETQPVPQEAMPPTPDDSGPPAETYDTSTLEGMLLEEGPPLPEQVPPAEPAPPGQDADAGSSPLEMMVQDEESRGPARLTLAPPEEPGGLPGHTEQSAAAIPPELADLWPEGSLNGHDYPVPPPPDQEERPSSDAQPFEQIPEQPPHEVEGLPEDDYMPGRTDQPSTMERLLDPGEVPGQEPPAQPQPPGPPDQGGAPPGPPPASPPPPSGWK